MASIFSSEELDAYFSSYAGMEGGNIGAAVWLCDKEPHLLAAAPGAALAPVHAPPAWDAAFRERHRHDMPRWQTHQRLARIMAATRAATLRETMPGVDWHAYFDQYLYAPGGWEFKLNLYPLPKPQHMDLAQIETFRRNPYLSPNWRYADFCRQGGRFRFIAGLRRRMRPKVILCTGQAEEEEFLLAFGFEGVPCTEHRLQPADLVKTLRVYSHEGTHLVICPKVGGPAGINSDTLLDAMGAFLSVWLEAADFAEARDTHCEFAGAGDGANLAWRVLPRGAEVPSGVSPA
ncbi:transcriptional regulator [Cupriavidus sp. 30B13]|uniref:transcriptional regulator n=1 Tax=Cupriavidus sp. 30B13 TaxID=3384241 RepID=UPI003B8F27B2